MKKAVAGTANSIKHTANFVEEAQQTANGLSSKAKTLTVCVLVGSTVFWLGSNFILDFKENGGSFQAACHGFKKRGLRMFSAFIFGAMLTGNPVGGVAAVIAAEMTGTLVDKAWKFPWRYLFFALGLALMGLCGLWLWANPMSVQALVPTLSWSLWGPGLSLGISATKTAMLFGFQVPLKVALIACKWAFYSSAVIAVFNFTQIAIKDLGPMANNQLKRWLSKKQKPLQQQHQPILYDH